MKFSVSRFSGINNRNDESRLGTGLMAVPAQPGVETQMEPLTEGVNIDIDDSEALVTRYGTSIVEAGNATSVYSCTAGLFFVIDGVLKQRLRDGSSKTLLSSIGPDVSFAEVANLVYFSDGVEVTGVISNGVVYDWGIKAPSVGSIALSRITGHLNCGTYHVTATYTDVAGLESGAPMATSITVVDNSGIRVTLPVSSDPRVSRVNVFVSPPDGKLIYLVGSVDNGVTHFNYTHEDYGRPLEYQWCDKPPALELLEYHRGRIIGSAGRFLMATKPLAYDLMDVRDFLSVNFGEVRTVSSVDTVLYVGTDTGMYVLKGDDLASVTIEDVCKGPVLKGSAVVVNSGEVFGTDNSALGVLFICNTDVFFGDASGRIANLTRNSYRVSQADSACAAFFAPGDRHVYMVFQF